MIPIAVLKQPVARVSPRVFSCPRSAREGPWPRRTCVRSTRAAHDRGIRREADVQGRETAARPLTTTELRWLLDQMARRKNGGVAAEPATDPGGTSDMISSNPGAQGSTASRTAIPVTPASETVTVPGTEIAVAAARPTLVALAAARAARASAAVHGTQNARSAPRAAPRADDTPYRAVFACALQAKDAPGEA